MDETKAKWYQAGWIKTTLAIVLILGGIGFGYKLQGSQEFDLANGGAGRLDYKVNKSIMTQIDECGKKEVGSVCDIKIDAKFTYTKAPTKVVEVKEVPDVNVDAVKVETETEVKPDVDVTKITIIKPINLKQLNKVVIQKIEPKKEEPKKEKVKKPEVKKVEEVKKIETKKEEPKKEEVKKPELKKVEDVKKVEPKKIELKKTELKFEQGVLPKSEEIKK